MKRAIDILILIRKGINDNISISKGLGIKPSSCLERVRKLKQLNYIQQYQRKYQHNMKKYYLTELGEEVTEDIRLLNLIKKHSVLFQDARGGGKR